MSLPVIFWAEKRALDPLFFCRLMSKLKNIIQQHLLPDHVLMDIRENGHSNMIRVIVDSERQLTLDDTADLTRRVRNSVDFETMFPKGIRLEVTTPGLNQPISLPFQFRKNINRNLRISYQDGNDIRTMTAIIVGADDNSVTLVNNGHRINVSYDQIKKAKVEISFN